MISWLYPHREDTEILPMIYVNNGIWWMPSENLDHVENIYQAQSWNTKYDSKII